jgi:hypothetical protein
MQVEDRKTGTRRRVMTISVQNARKVITQARGRCNRLPGARGASFRLKQAPEILHGWTKQGGCPYRSILVDLRSRSLHALQ